ncbi:cob(I)yrinic acid a,c-diamide adenosyltransferase [Armatimonas sp.]|uniref:cob(I)yrinic acid a,c-diamide adenosyltransferase n=1 Tax=Armatimonas sp. TaxID=1872638 RepID=UPI00286BCFAF|nr:cob(I)yrinic acid a,c-diamide adenosyltransferase [Armatimonas sp.]
MKLYTRTGDSGKTGLYGGERVRKDSLRVAAYGCVDEANAALGVAATLGETLRLQKLQAELFVVGGDLATPLSEGDSRVPRISPEETAWLEREIDLLEAELEPLRSFILPGGVPLAAALHLARTVVRRTERAVVTLYEAEPDQTNPETICYLNRLSDFLFSLARFANQSAGQPDILWKRSAS